jgi:hypothetical protein
MMELVDFYSKVHISLPFYTKRLYYFSLISFGIAFFCRGHGTYVGKDGSLVASVVGTVERVNKLVTVKGVGGVYNGEVGIT